MSFLQFFSERQLPRLRANIAEPWGTGPGLARAKIGARGNAVFECFWFLEPDPLTVSNSHIRGLGLSLALWSEILAVNRSGRSPPDKSVHWHETSRECQFYMLRSWKFIMQIIGKSLCAGPGKTENIHYPNWMFWRYGWGRELKKWLVPVSLVLTISQRHPPFDNLRQFNMLLSEIHRFFCDFQQASLHSGRLPHIQEKPTRTFSIVKSCYCKYCKSQLFAS